MKFLRWFVVVPEMLLALLCYLLSIPFILTAVVGYIGMEVLDSAGQWLMDSARRWEGRCAVAIALVGMSLLCGCLSVTRVPLVRHADYDDDGICTNRVWCSFYDDRPDLRVYPTVKMRGWATYVMFHPVDYSTLTPELKYRNRMARYWGWIPVTAMWLTFPPDFVLDTVFLPYDLYVVW